MNDKAETPTAQMNAPSGLDLNPRPPRSVRVSKRAAGALMAIAAVILGLFAYGGYKRQQRQVATLAGESIPRNVAPATAAGAEIAKEVPSGSVVNAAQQRGSTVDPGTLQAPGELQSSQANPLPNGSQVYVRQAPASTQPVAAQVPPRPEPSPEERRLIAAYEREQQAIAAPTRLREGFGSLAVANGPETDSSATRTRGDDAAQIAAVVQGLVRQNGNSQVIRTAAQTRPTRTDENGVHLDRLEIMEVDP